MSMSMNKDSSIYKKALQKANDVYGEKSSIYRSSYIVKTYKDLGGKMSPKRSKQRSKNRRSIRRNGEEPRKRSKNTRSNRKRSKETEEFGWNPYAGMCDVKSDFHLRDWILQWRS